MQIEQIMPNTVKSKINSSSGKLVSNYKNGLTLKLFSSVYCGDDTF